MGVNEAIAKIELRQNLLQEALYTVNDKLAWINTSNFNS
jgi:hypothetical protein